MFSGGSKELGYVLIDILSLTLCSYLFYNGRVNFLKTIVMMMLFMISTIIILSLPEQRSAQTHVAKFAIFDNNVKWWKVVVGYCSK